MSKRASGRLRHAVRVELVIAVAQRGPHPWPSQRAAAAELAELVDAAPSTIRRALSDPTLAAEVALAIGRPGEPPGSHPGSHEGATDPTAENGQVDDPPPAPPDEVTPHSSTRALLSGPAIVPPASPGRRPSAFRRSSFAGRCVLCLDELPLGRAFYLVPYDASTSVYCHNDAALGLAMAQMFYDVTRGRPVPDELELYVRERPAAQ